MKGIDLKVLRIRSGVRQYELAAQLGMNPSRLSLVESERVPLEPDVASRAAVILSAGNLNAAHHGVGPPGIEAIDAAEDAPAGEAAPRSQVAVCQGS